MGANSFSYNEQGVNGGERKVVLRHYLEQIGVELIGVMTKAADHSHPRHHYPSLGFPIAILAA